MTILTALNGVPNFRDVGGLPVAQGRATKPGVLYRSSALNTATDIGVADMASSDLAYIADLRTPEEVALNPDRLPTTRSIDYDHLPIATGNLTPAALTQLQGSGASEAAVAAHIPSLGDLYVTMLEGSAQQFAQVARYVTQGATLVHCTAGKDRTGVACALILDAVGVDRDAVVANYAESAQLLAGPWADSILAQLKAAGIPPLGALVELVTTTPPAAIEQAFAWVEKNHGSSINYLESGGLTQAELQLLHTRLVS